MPDRGARRHGHRRPLALLLTVAVALSGCMSPPQRPPPSAPQTVVIQPVDVVTTYITARTPRFARGQFALVEVCIAADGTIAGARVTQSSTDKAFDAAAIHWAQQARYHPQLANGRPVYGCREVRVEINPNPNPEPGRGSVDSALG